MEHTACNIIASTSSKIQHATPTSTSTYALFAAAGPEFAQPPKAQARWMRALVQRAAIRRGYLPTVAARPLGIGGRWSRIYRRYLEHNRLHARTPQTCACARGCGLSGQGRARGDTQEVDPLLLEIRFAADNADNCTQQAGLFARSNIRFGLGSRTLEPFFELLLLLRLLLRMRLRRCLILALDVDPDRPVRHRYLPTS